MTTTSIFQYTYTDILYRCLMQPFLIKSHKSSFMYYIGELTTAVSSEIRAAHQVPIYINTVSNTGVTGPRSNYPYPPPFHKSLTLHHYGLIASVERFTCDMHTYIIIIVLMYIK